MTDYGWGAGDLSNCLYEYRLSLEDVVDISHVLHYTNPMDAARELATGEKPRWREERGDE